MPAIVLLALAPPQRRNVLTSNAADGLVQIPDTVKPLTDPTGNWGLRPDLSDEFNGESIDTTKWQDTVRSWGAWSWSAKNVEVSSNTLFITMRYDPAMRRPRFTYYTSGILRSRRTVLYGYFEARIKAAPVFPGVAPAFWATYDAPSRSEWTEIDFVELTQGPLANDIATNTHVFRYAGLAAPIHERHQWVAPFDPRQNFHVYGCDWAQDSIHWYVDGHLVRSTSNTYWHQPLWVNLSMGLRGPLVHHPSPNGFPTTMQVDYVRVWRRGP